MVANRINNHSRGKKSNQGKSISNSSSNREIALVAVEKELLAVTIIMTIMLVKPMRDQLVGKISLKVVVIQVENAVNLEISTETAEVLHQDIIIRAILRKVIQDNKISSREVDIKLVLFERVLHLQEIEETMEIIENA